MSAALKLNLETEDLSEKPRLGEKRPKPRLVWENPKLTDGTQQEKPKAKPGSSYGRVLYNYFRDYDPGTGRYITADPIGLDGGLNTYEYALNNPIRVYDPFGLEPNPTCVAACTIGGGLIGGAAGYFGGGVVGGILGGAGGSLVGPGGTLAGGTAGATAGSKVGGAAGAAAGSTAGNAAGNALCPDDKDECDKQLERDETMCNLLSGTRYGSRGIALCYASAKQRYGECRRFGPGGVTTPLHGVDTPL